MSNVLRLFDFQETAANQIAEAAADWVQYFVDDGPLYLGKTPIPFVGHLKAVTGAGKTPILARVVADLTPAIVLWTSKSSAVADQTYRNLNGKYSHLLPAGTRVVRERPSKSEWEELLESTAGLTIWVTTVGSWNEAEYADSEGSESARLNMHRPHRDWGGERSPWDQLRSLPQRPLWVVYDESHNQTPTQLEQLIGLKPVGFLLASATPPAGGQFERFAEVVEDDARASEIAARGRYRILTKDVVENELLKHTIMVENFDSDPDQLLDAAVALHGELSEAAASSGSGLNPKALYIVERSNPRKDEIISRPVAIWEHLRARGVDAENIAVYTQTKLVPDEAVRISSLAELQPHHTHIICNRALQEGWDDPEAYIEYFDDESNSYVRIAQVIGRALRQPAARHYADDRLNTSTLFVRVPNRTFDGIVEGLKAELALYAADEAGSDADPAIRIRTRKDPLQPVPVKQDIEADISLPQYVLGEAELEAEKKKIRVLSQAIFAEEHLAAKGRKMIQKISLRGEEDTTKYEQIAASMRRKNGEYLRRRVQLRSRHCAHLLEPELFTGPAYEQWSCSGSTAQGILSERASAMADAFESTVDLVPNEIYGEETWSPSAYTPTSDKFYSFNNAVHAKYAQNQFNAEELAFAKVLDSLNRGVWMRNPARGDGYGILLPVKVGTSSTFYPDFLWWVDGKCFALDPTGKHILEEKVRGKLLTVEKPKIALFTRGTVSADFHSLVDTDGYTLVRPRSNRAPAPEHLSSVEDALLRLAPPPPAPPS
ncbi:DEAD/DEAH box helicase family protein [Curtobacterium sp. PhB78]|uniref:DEAD/DEAH box helicase family protein n=1 Tax=Curtobacterium sp. PhB78 TaxID=2485102 RepID=UPI000F46D014|nr:DEAD/DEAH box helicase family protein [Curtobacterium sp. PhB78]ROS45998.1 type III restriction enzyme [Curtobacterium sp. PhB78]